MSLKALVAVRSGSQRVKNKNIRPFAGSSLLEIKLKQLKRIPQLNGIIVNSNDDTMLLTAKNMGCETVKRERYYASNFVCMSEVYQNMAEHCDCDEIAYINVTNPLIQDHTIIQAIEIYNEFKNKYDSLNSAHLIKKFLFQNHLPANYDLRNQPRSQDLPDIFALNFGVSIISRDKMIAYKNIVGHHPYLYTIDDVEAIDIDTKADFDIAEFMYMREILGGYKGKGEKGLCLYNKEAAA